MTTRPAELATYGGVSRAELQRRAGVDRLVMVEQCTSTMDLAHALAGEGAPHGTTVVAEEQHAGRGRSGKRWTSTARDGVWASVILRDALNAATGLLSLRTGMALARALEARADRSVQLKWPNDLFMHGAKLAGILTEARWRGETLEWIVVGVGVNVGGTAEALPDAERATLIDASLGEVLVDVVHAVLSAASASGLLDESELAEFDRRDVAKGRVVSSPVTGVVAGITSAGGLRVLADGQEQVAVAGSLVFGTS